MKPLLSQTLQAEHTVEGWLTSRSIMKVTAQGQSQQRTVMTRRQLVLLLMRTAIDRQFVLLRTRTILIRTTPMRTMLLVLAEFRTNRLI